MTVLSYSEIYDRNPDGTLAPRAVVVIGCGGVGSWVAYLMALGGTRSMVLIDHDIVEVSNLNRCPFRPEHVGMLKVDAISQVVSEHRPDLNVVAIPMKVESVPPEILLEFRGYDAFVDCRDIGTPLPKSLGAHTVITGGYDGTSCTINVTPDYDSPVVYNENGDVLTGPVTYRTTPSYVIPPVFIASMIVNYLAVESKNSMFTSRKRVGKAIIPVDFRKILWSMRYSVDKQIEQAIEEAKA